MKAFFKFIATFILLLILSPLCVHGAGQEDEIMEIIHKVNMGTPSGIVPHTIRGIGKYIF